MNNLQTSIPGIACIICAALIVIFGTQTPESIGIASALAFSGLGLLNAKDAKGKDAVDKAE